VGSIPAWPASGRKPSINAVCKRRRFNRKLKAGARYKKYRPSVYV